MAFGKPREEGRIGGQSVERGLAGGGGCGHRPSLSPVPRSFTRRTGSGQRPLRGGEQTFLHPCHSRESGNPEHASARSEKRRVGKEGVSTCRYRWSQEH